MSTTGLQRHAGLAPSSLWLEVQHPPVAAPARARPLHALLLFEKEWDGGGLAPMVKSGELCLYTEGFDLFQFPDNARLLTFDAWRFVDRICAKYRGRIGAVISANEQFGALLAAVIAQRLGLPGADPAAACAAHHKLVARAIQHRLAPHATVPSLALPFELGDPRSYDEQALSDALTGLGRGFPLFVKPIKATFSVLARRIDSAHELARHLRFGPFERLIIERLVRPYAQIAKRLIDMPCDPTRMLLEESVDEHQVNVDGYVFNGEVRVLGLVDAWMYPREAAGAKHFLRFSYPSIVQGAARERVTALTRQIVEAIGLRHGFFNCEFFVCRNGDVKFIEMNPRVAAQFVAMYRDVEGLDGYRMLVDLAAGRDPAATPRLWRKHGASASLVWRKFDGTTGAMPAPGALDWLATQFPHARLAMFHKRGRGLAREYKWLGSHRYAVMNLSARDERALNAAFERICLRFGWPCEFPDTEAARSLALPSARQKVSVSA